MQLPAPNEMDVQMEHRLAGSWAHVQHRSITILNSSVSRDFRCCEVTAADRVRIFQRCFLKARKMFLRNDQHMGRRLGIDVLESERVLVLVDFLGRNFAVDNSAE